MLRFILVAGIAAGLIVAVPMCLFATLAGPGSASASPVVGYLTMIAALSLIFVAVKRHRDRTLGGAIKFVPAMLIGLGISAVAGVVYVIGWEIALWATDYAFAEAYSRSTIAAARAKGASAAELERLGVQMQAFQVQYANPFFRLPITFVEIFPVGLLISVVTAALLRNPRFLPAQ